MSNTRHPLLISAICLAVLFGLAACGAEGQAKFAADNPWAGSKSCPDWSVPYHAEYSNVAGRNFGCTFRENLAKTVANPDDLHQGQPTDPADASNAVLGIQRYQTDQTKPLNDNNSPTGAQSGGG
jgi:Pilus biogenesis CpaD protein (pilus_cpaD)